MSKCIYVAGPIGARDAERPTRVRAAIDAAERIRRAGLFPFVPHLADLWDETYPHHYECWMKYAAVWLAKCDALFRVPGPSPGADREITQARDLLVIPVFFELDALFAWARVTAHGGTL